MKSSLPTIKRSGRWILALCLLFMGMGVEEQGRAAGFSVKAGDLLVANYGDNSVLKIDAATGAAEKLGDFVTPTDVVLAPNGDLFISEWGGLIHRMNLTNGTVTVVNPDTTLVAVWGLVIGPDGNLIVSCGGFDSIVKINAVTGEETLISELDLLWGISGIELLDANHVVVCSTFTSQIVQVALDDGTQTAVPIVGGGIDQPRGITAFNTNLFVTALDSREIRTLPAVGGTVRTLGNTTGFAHGLGMETNGNIIAGTSLPFEVVRMNPEGTVLRAYTSPLLSEVTGVEVSRLTLTAAPGSTNTPPVLDPIADQVVDEGSLLTFSVTATDADFPPQTLSFVLLSATAPSGASLSPEGVFSWTPSEAQGPSTNLIGVVVTDTGSPPLSDTNTFTVIVNEVNSAPIPGSHFIYRYPRAGAKVRAASVLGSDPDGDALSLYSAGPTSLQGGTVTTNESWIIYTPPTGFTNADSFTYQVTDPHGALGAGTIEVGITNDTQPSQNLLTEDLGNGSVRLRFSGIPQQTYAVQFNTNLLESPWQPLTTNQADAFGVLELIDTPPNGGPPRLYRSTVP